MIAKLAHFPDGWTPFAMQAPPEGRLVSFRDERSNLQWVGTSYDIGQEPTAYLWWKLTGIAKEGM